MPTARHAWPYIEHRDNRWRPVVLIAVAWNLAGQYSYRPFVVWVHEGAGPRHRRIEA